ncbi:unnamed protein product, partial [Anisakis simplex]|uniref:Calponin-homology (CH) domain-containing protein n=1 Tax=Anisakis simplex TaxID=6269 RepID=A0A0M3JE66_ANISI
MDEGLRRESIRLNCNRRQSMYGPATKNLQGAELLMHVYRQLAENYGIFKKWTFQINGVEDLADGVLFAKIWRDYIIGGQAIDEFSGDTLIRRVANAAEEVLGVPSGLIA